MTIGSGIFLAALVSSLTFLFIATKDRWRWKRLVVWSVGTLTAVVTLTGGALWGYNAWEDRIRPIDEIGSIRLGMTRGDVLFFKGKPAEEVEGDWVYREESGSIAYRVSFTEEKVDSVLALGESVYLPRFYGISFFSGTRDLELRLGPPDFVATSADGLSRMLHYRSLNLTFGYKKDRLEVVGIRTGGRTFTFTEPADQ
ncbi:MAG: hypothetical protein LT102_15875 [Burkholderiaceae bacterium]|nr:hypothetical protein [Burkholderiaceae bacterium]